MTVSGSLQRQTKRILAQQMHCAVSAEELQKTVISQIAAKSTAGPRPIVIELTIVFVVSVLEEDTTLLIGVYHVDFATALCFVRGFGKAHSANVGHADIDSNMPAHFFYEIDFTGVQDYLSVLPATDATLAAFMENSPQSTFIDMVSYHLSALL